MAFWRKLRTLPVSALLLAPLLLHAAEVQVRMVLGAQPVAGFQYYAGKRVWDDLQVGDMLALVREADNTYDPNAVRVEWHGEKLGYVPHAGNATVAKLLDKGIKVSGRIINLHPGRSQWQRILFEVVVDE
jgi:hypothetical protein